MKIAIASIFRDSEKTLPLYMAQCRELDSVLRQRNDSLHGCWAWGDSTDRTGELLVSLSKGLSRDIVRKDHGGPVFGPVVDQRRFFQKSLVDNAALELLPTDTAVLLYVEGDLCFEPSTMVRLVDHVLAGRDMVTALVYCQTRFRDTWAFRGKGGVPFYNDFPYSRAINWTGLTEMDSCGSLFALRGDVALKTRVPPRDEWLSYCWEIRKQGCRIWLDSSLSVRHPWNG